MSKSLLQVLNGERQSIPPVWMMRQAGRYLPEYRAVREKAGGFLDLCFSPELAAEVTLQPIRRFGFDAAILFSDILVIPHALGRKVSFVAGEGPKLDPIENPDIIAKLPLEADQKILGPVYETVARVKSELAPDVTLLGFCGAPWTVATYMIAGEGTPDQAPARIFAYRHPEAFAALIDRLVNASIAYLVRQLQAGADAVQIFDTWAGVSAAGGIPQMVDGADAENRRRRAQANSRCEDHRISARRRQHASALYASHRCRCRRPRLDDRQDLRARKSADASNRCRAISIRWLCSPAAHALDRGVDMVMEAFANGPFIFNLGHGILPETPIENVERMIKRVRG